MDVFVDDSGDDHFPFAIHDVVDLAVHFAEVDPPVVHAGKHQPVDDN